MFDSNLFRLAILGATAWLILTAFTCRFVFRRHGAKGGIPFLVLRMTTLGLLVYLIWIIFWNFEETDKKEKAEEESRQVIVLQDDSGSMSFGSDKRTRKQLADDVWKRCEELGNANNIAVKRLYYASNLVEEKQAEHLRRDATQTGMALAKTLSRYRLNALVVVSDGAATDGRPPKYVMDWAKNRDIALYAIGAGTHEESSFDFYVDEVRCDRTNPKEVEVVIGCRGKSSEAVDVQFSIDGKGVSKQSTKVEGKCRLKFAIPKLVEGWHEYAIRIAKVAGELTEQNNPRLGVFRILPPRKILLLYHAPKLEYRHMARFLARLYPDQLVIMSVNDPKCRELKISDFILVIIGDMAPKYVPVSVMRGIKKRESAVLVLTGQHIGKWSSRHVSGFPIEKHRKRINLHSKKQQAGSITKSPENWHPGFRRTSFDALKLYQFDDVQLSNQAKPVVSVRHRNKTYPLLVTDRLDKPRVMALLSDTTWRWGLSPEPRVRSAYRAFWRRLFNWIVGLKGDAHELSLSFKQRSLKDETRIEVSHDNAATTIQLKQVQVNADFKSQASALKATLADEEWVCTYPNPPDRPKVIWFQAVAGFNGRTLQSMEKPLLLDVNSQELLHAQARPQELQALVRDVETDYAPAQDCDAVLKRVFDRLRKDESQQRVRQRNWRRELILAAIVILLLSMEWLLERSLKERIR